MSAETFSADASCQPTDPFVEHLLGIGDDALLTAQRLGEWYAAAPEMEEDIALANIALDQLGTARLVLSYAGEVEGAGRDEDALAFRRDPPQFRNALLVELPNGDFAYTIVRLLLLSAYQRMLYEAAARGDDPTLAGIAAKASKESAYHLDHSTQWTLRLGDGTEESRRRVQTALEDLWPYSHELFASNGGDDRRMIDRTRLRAPWLSIVEPILVEATLTRPVDGWAPAGGRCGAHATYLDRLLTEMQTVHRAHPGAQW